MKHGKDLRKELGQRDPDHVISATLVSRDSTIEGVVCKLYLPKKFTEPVYLLFEPSNEQYCWFFRSGEFRIRAQIENIGRFVKFHADRVYAAHAQSSWRESNITERFVVAEAWDLEISTFCSSVENTVTPITSGVFWLTPSRLLEPAVTVMPLWTGEVKVSSSRTFDLTLPNGPVLLFRMHFCFEHLPSGGWTATPQLAVEFDGHVDTQELPALVKQLDDILLLGSLAERHRCVCFGWRIHRAKDSFAEFFRCGIAAPQEELGGIYDGLIDPREFQDFLRTSCSAFASNSEKEGLRQAIEMVLGARNATIDAAYLKLFRALEILVSWFKKKEGLEQILPPREWKCLKKVLRRSIEEDLTLKDDNKKTALMVQKLEELNRIAFGAAFRLCVNSLSSAGFSVADLWPVIGLERGTSLSEVRNKLVHGMVLTPPQVDALGSAHLHLRWCVERLLLAVLGWPVARSNISPERIGRLYPGLDWEKQQAAFSIH